MKTTIIIILLSSLSLTALAQKYDYEIVRNDFTILSCGKTDSLTVLQCQLKLERADTNKFNKNIAEYYRDLASTYFKLFFIRKDTTFLLKSIDNNKMAISHNPEYSSAFWDNSYINYYFFHNCQQGKYYLEKYKKITPKKYWVKDQIKKLVSICN